MDTRVKPAYDECWGWLVLRFTTSVVIPRESGGSSTPRPLDSITGVSGILDRPVKPAMATHARLPRLLRIPHRPPPPLPRQLHFQLVDALLRQLLARRL